MTAVIITMPCIMFLNMTSNICLLWSLVLALNHKINCLKDMISTFANQVTTIFTWMILKKHYFMTNYDVIGLKTILPQTCQPWKIFLSTKNLSTPWYTVLACIPKNNMHENLHVFTAESCQWRCVIALSFNLEAGGRPRAENPHDMQYTSKRTDTLQKFYYYGQKNPAIAVTE